MNIVWGLFALAANDRAKKPLALFFLLLKPALKKVFAIDWQISPHKQSQVVVYPPALV